MKRLAIAALVAVSATACQSAPPAPPVDCAALVAEFEKVSGVHDWFVAREGELGPSATEAFDQMTALNDSIQESCR